MKFSAKVGNGPINKRLNFGGDPDHRLDTGIVFFGFVTIGRYGNWYQPTALRDAGVHGIAITTMTSLRHRPLAEVCTVPVLLLLNVSSFQIFRRR